MTHCENCGEPFVPKRPHARFCSDSCRAIDWRAKSGEEGAERVLEHPLDLVRGDAEESPEKARWTLIVREQIAHTLTEKGWFSVRDLDDLDIPAEHVNVCTSQIGSFASAKHMVKRTWQRSEKVSRKGGPYWTFQITASGREKLPALLEDERSKLADLIAGPDTENPEGRAGTKSTAPSTGRCLPMGTPDGAGSSISVRPGEGGERQEDAAGPASAESPVSPAPTPSPARLPGLSPISAYSGENPYA